MLELGRLSYKRGSRTARFPRTADSVMESVRAFKRQSEMAGDPVSRRGLDNGYLQYVETGLRTAFEVDIEARDCGSSLSDLLPSALHIPALPEKCLTLVYDLVRMETREALLLKPSLPFVALCREELTQFSEGAGFTVTIVPEINGEVWCIPQFMYFFPYKGLTERRNNQATLDAFTVEGFEAHAGLATSLTNTDSPQDVFQQNMDKLMLVLRALTRIHAVHASVRFPAVYLP